MATQAEVKALLGVACPWCEAGIGVRCNVRSGGRTGSVRAVRAALTLSTLDGGCHDARWQAALGLGARVIAEAVAEARRDPRKEQPVDLEQPGSATATAVLERPW